MAKQPILLTGDTPTGKLHLGHWVGSLENRVALQKDYQCYFILANTHAFTTHLKQPQAIQHSVLDIVSDYLACGIDPNKSTIFVESDVPEILELTAWFSMLIPYARLMRNPTIKDEIRDKELGDQYSMGFLYYPIMQVADILAFQAEVVPVGEDQVPHLELTREVARRFNQIFCGVDPHLGDSEQIKAGGLFPIPEPLIGRVKRLVGTGGPGAHGALLKMSKSLNNAILLSDDNDTIRKKVMGMYTDPTRLKATDPGHIENNPLWIFHDTFNPDTAWVEETKEQYKAGSVGDVVCKKKLVEVLVDLIEPMQQRRAQYADDPAEIHKVLQKGKEKARESAATTLSKLKETIHQVF